MRTKFFPPIALLIALVAGVLAWQQWRTATEMRARITPLDRELRGKSDALTEQAGRIARLQEENNACVRESSMLREKLAGHETDQSASASNAPASAAPSTAGFESIDELLRRTMHDPQARERRRHLLMASLKLQYTPFVEANHLTPAQSEQFFALQVERDMSDMEDGLNFFAGDKDESGASESAARLAELEQVDMDGQLRTLLSESAYANYQEYEKTISDRVALTQMRQELAMNSQPLSEDQAHYLSQVLLDERSKTPPLAFDPRTNSRTRDKYRIAVEGDNAARYLEAQAGLDQRVLARAKTILSPEQYDALATFQRQNFDGERTAIELARKVIGQKNNSADNAVSAPISTPSP